MPVKSHVGKYKYVQACQHFNVTYLFEVDESDVIHAFEDKNSNIGRLTFDKLITKSNEPYMIPEFEKIVKKWKSMINLIKRYDGLQTIYGSKNLNPVYGCGEDHNPRIALVFMNPTKRNIATDKSWKGLKAQWLGTKQIWEFLEKCGLFSSNINEKIKSKKPKDWTFEFCEYVYNDVRSQGLCITNLAKCTQEDARPLPDSVFLKYKDLLK